MAAKPTLEQGGVLVLELDYHDIIDWRGSALTHVHGKAVVVCARAWVGKDHVLLLRGIDAEVRDIPERNVKIDLDTAVEQDQEEAICIDIINFGMIQRRPYPIARHP